MQRRKSAILTLVATLLASWLSLACGHCWAMAEPAAQTAGSHCQHAPPAEQEPSCCDHQHQGPVCPEAQVDATPIMQLTAMAGTASAELLPCLPADDRPWQPWRSPPRDVPGAILSFDPASPPLYLRHCAFLK